MFPVADMPVADAGNAGRASIQENFPAHRGPLSKPAVITIAIFDFTWGWHDYINPLDFLRDPDKFTLPMIVVVFFAQRTFIKGISFTGVKG